MLRSLVLPAVVARRVNLVVGSLLIVVTIGNTISESWAYYWLGPVVETALLLLIVKYAWTWPRGANRSDGHPAVDAARSDWATL